MKPEIAALIVAALGLVTLLGWRLVRPMRSKKDGGK